MIQVKFFQGNTTNYEKLEKDINEWIEKHNVTPIDIKFQKDTGEREVMIIYDDFYTTEEITNVCYAAIDNKGNVNDIHRFFEEDLEMNEFMKKYPTTGGKE